MFENMMHRIREATIDYLFKIQIAPQPVRRERVVNSNESTNQTTAPQQLNVINKKHNDADDIKPLEKIGRNDPCPCGSGKKYKKCCGGK
jgi:preprotein translocase subunit SecA